MATIKWTTSPSSGLSVTMLDGHFYRLERTGSHRWTVFEYGNVPNDPSAGTYGKTTVMEASTKREAKERFATYTNKAARSK